MSLVTGSYASIIQGVSTQAPRDRVEGASWELTNMYPDPVDGLVRRPGAKHVAAGALVQGATAFRWHDIVLNGKEHFLALHTDGTATVIDAETGAVLTTGQSASSKTYLMNEVTADTSIGDYTLVATTVKPVLAAATTTTRTAGRMMVEVRQGAYSGTYKVIRRSTGVVLATYTVPDGSAVGDLAKAQPGYIANQLKTGLLTGTGANACTVVEANGILTVDFSTTATAQDVGADDGVYNSRLRVLFDYNIDTPTLPAIAPHGMVVRIGRLDQSIGDYYLKFVQHDGKTSSTPLTGKWIECAVPGVQAGGSVVNTTMPVLFKLHAANNKCYIGTAPEIAAAIFADTAVTLVPLDWGVREAGDDSTNTDPLFADSIIRWMGIFQERLVIISGNSCWMSRTSDYLEIYHASVVTVLDDDTINMSSTFNAEDQLIGAALYDKNLVIVGTKTHYSIPGSVPVTPSSGMAVTAAYESAPSVHPITLGDGVYFCSATTLSTDVLFIQSRTGVDNTKVEPVSTHASGYIPGDVSKMYNMPKTDMLFLRTASGKLVCYRTFIIQQKRALSAWFKFEFATRADSVLKAMAVKTTVLRLLFTRTVGSDVYYEIAHLDLDRKGYLPSNGQYYLDFWKTETAASGTTQLNDNRGKCVLGADYVVQNPTTGFLDGVTALNGADYQWTNAVQVIGAVTGNLYVTSWSPTLPVQKDSTGKPTALGRLTVVQMQITYIGGSAFSVNVKDKYREYNYAHSIGKLSSDSLVIGSTEIGGGKYLFPVASAETEARVTITAKNHYPLVVTYVDWKGQYFKHGRSM